MCCKSVDATEVIADTNSIATTFELGPGSRLVELDPVLIEVIRLTVWRRLCPIYRRVPDFTATWLFDDLCCTYFDYDFDYLWKTKSCRPANCPELNSISCFVIFSYLLH